MPKPGTERQSRDRRALRRVQLLVAASAVAAVTAVVMPPLGLALGLATLITAGIRRRDMSLAGLGRVSRIIPFAGGSFAVLAGGLMSVALLVIGDEIDDYQRCHAGANTRAAEERCQSEFMDAIERRLGSG